MALRVWLPLNGNLKNKGLTNIGDTPLLNSLTLQDNGKLGKCYKGAALYHLQEDFLKNQWTIAVWVKQDGSSWQTYNDIILCKNNSAAQDGQFYLSVIGGNKLNIGINKHSEQYKYDYTFATNTWYHIAAAFNGTNYYLYLNGNLVLTGADTSVYDGTALNLTLNGRSQSEAGSLYSQTKILNDVRIYDECLSQKEIKEISKGLVCHYKFNNPYIETTTNMAPGVSKATAYSKNTNPAWDKTLNGDIMYYPSGWGTGYNGGITNPTQGYHAHWVFDETGKLIMIFPNLNSEIEQKSRWLGISATCSGMPDVLAGEKYTISWWQKTDNLALTVWGGMYYKKTSSGSYTFGDGCPSLGYNTKLNTWQFFSKTFTRASDYVQHDATQSIYIYGNDSDEGTIYVKNVQVERGDHATPYAVGTREGQNYIEDGSGYGNNGAINNLLTYNEDSNRYNGSSIFAANTTIQHPRCLESGTDQEWTCTAWIKPTAGTANSRLNNFNLANRIYHNANNKALLYLNSGANDYYKYSSSTIPTNQWSHIAFVFRNSDKLIKIYINGEDCTGTGPESGVPGTIPDTITIGENFEGSMNDYREYCTALSADDIRQLYQTGAWIDNQQNTYAYELQENNNSKINKNGIIETENFQEYELPLEYQEVEYIESTGTQYINMEVNPNTNTQWELKFRKITSNHPYHGSYANNQRFRIDNNSAGLGTGYYLFNGDTSVILQNIDYLVYWNSKNITIALDGIVQKIGTNFTNEVPLYLFAMNNNNSSITYGTSRVYYTKIWQDNKLIRNLIPCYKISDSTIGMYDLVNNKFYPNEGTGIFTKGNNIRHKGIYQNEVVANNFIEI